MSYRVKFHLFVTGGLFEGDQESCKEDRNFPGTWSWCTQGCECGQIWNYSHKTQSQLAVVCILTKPIFWVTPMSHIAQWNFVMTFCLCGWDHKRSSGPSEKKDSSLCLLLRRFKSYPRCTGFEELTHSSQIQMCICVKANVKACVHELKDNMLIPCYAQATITSSPPFCSEVNIHVCICSPGSAKQPLRLCSRPMLSFPRSVLIGCLVCNKKNTVFVLFSESLMFYATVFIFVLWQLLQTWKMSIKFIVCSGAEAFVYDSWGLCVVTQNCHFSLKYHDIRIAYYYIYNAF